jgi:two-component system cell cycle sensor histidine kinase/response regulator CckA
VQDTGCGIPKSQRQRIFEPFYTTRADRGGSGLGLATVRSIMESHGGLIALDSAPGVGSTFVLNFKALEPELEAQPDTEPELDLEPEFDLT